MGFWGRLCTACDVTTGERDPSYARCWNCGATLCTAKEYDPVKVTGRGPLMYPGALTADLLEESP